MDLPEDLPEAGAGCEFETAVDADNFCGDLFCSDAPVLAARGAEIAEALTGDIAALRTELETLPAGCGLTTAAGADFGGDFADFFEDTAGNFTLIDCAADFATACGFDLV